MRRLDCDISIERRNMKDRKGRGPPDHGRVSPHYLLPVFEYSSYLKLKDLKKESCGQESVDGSDKQETFKLLGKLIKKRALLTAGCKNCWNWSLWSGYILSPQLSSDILCMTGLKIAGREGWDLRSGPDSVRLARNNIPLCARSEDATLFIFHIERYRCW